jgi:RNA recognition motif-containing protein
VSKKLYVGNLQWATTDEHLKELFSNHGTVVSVQIITDRETGRSKGFGFIEMSSDEEAENAMRDLNNRELGGRNLKVNEAKKRNSSRRSFA